jgi:hypothetical protein
LAEIRLQIQIQINTGDGCRMTSSDIYASGLTKGLYGDGVLMMSCHVRVSYLIINCRVPVTVMVPVTVVG